MKRSHYALVAAFSCVLVVLAGCSSDPRAKVSGKVTFKEKPLHGGTVVFVSEDGVRQERVTIQNDGTYSSNNVPVGNVKIGVEPAAKGIKANMPKGEKKPNIPEDNPALKAYEGGGGEYVNIPLSQRDPTKSQITFEVKSGVDNTFDITVKDIPDGNKGSGGMGSGSKGSSKGF